MGYEADIGPRTNLGKPRLNHAPTEFVFTVSSCARHYAGQDKGGEENLVHTIKRVKCVETPKILRNVFWSKTMSV